MSSAQSDTGAYAPALNSKTASAIVARRQYAAKTGPHNSATRSSIVEVSPVSKYRTTIDRTPIPYIPTPNALRTTQLCRHHHHLKDLADLEIPLREAAAHVQFETIRPCLDGNGRIGRLRISLLLANWDVLNTPLLYLSLYLKRNQQKYYELLRRVREHGWIDWFQFFLAGIRRIANGACDTASELHKRVGNTVDS